MPGPVPQYVLFDNSALNYISGQPQHGSQLAEVDRKVLVDTVRGSVAAGDAVAVVNYAALGELAGLYFKDRARFDLVRDFLFKDWAVRVLRPTFDSKVQPLRTRMEVLAKAKVPMVQALYWGAEWKHLRKIFQKGKRKALDLIAKDSKARKGRFAAGQKTDRDKAIEELAEAGQDWSAEFAGWETDPKTVVDEWTEFEMNHNRTFYGLPVDKTRWPAPRDFVSLWFARGYVTARLRDIFGEGRKATDGGDLYDNIYFEDAAYSDVFVTGDETLARRGRSLGLSSPRILLTEEWVADVLKGRPSGG
jgi:hypothetical protein